MTRAPDAEAGARTSATVTSTLTVLLALAAVALLPHAGGEPFLPVHLPWVPFALVVMFAAAEGLPVDVEFRRQAYSFTLAGVPLVLGLLACAPWQVAAARLVGTAVVFAAQRVTWTKALYNLAAFAFEVGLAGWMLRLLEDQTAQVSLTMRTAVVTGVTLFVVDLLMTGLVLVLIRVHEGHLTSVTSVLVSAAVFNAVTLVYALTAVELSDDGTVGWCMLGGIAVVSVVGYRAYTVLSNRHRFLAHMSQFVEKYEPTDDVEALAGQRLAGVRSLLGASRAEAVLADADGRSFLVLSVDAEDNLTTRSVEAHDLDWLQMRVRMNDEALKLPRATKDAGLRRWLSEHDARDAVVVPLVHGEGLHGTLVVFDRLVDFSTFTDDDVTMLRALAGHLGVALRGTRLLHRLRHDATHDLLTGLANRALLQERLNEALAHVPVRQVAVLLMDMDHFKEVNDALGHDVGDALLRVLAQRLRGECRSDATVARLGGDEFAVLLPLAAGEDAHAAAEALAGRLAAVVAEPVQLDDALLSVEVSIGIATTIETSAAADLLRHADTAMYAAKSAGGGVHRYTPELDRGRAERLALVADLRLAMDRDELVMLYQPKMDLLSRRIIGAEALVRWQHPRLGLLSPDVFVPLAENTGLVGPLLTKVLGMSLDACRSWRDAGLDVTVAVNLSARNVTNPNLPELVAAALDERGLPASALVLEITESSVMTDPVAAVEVLERLRADGVSLSLDDFGTGYSSLAYLQELPVQEVKIDRSFVGGLGTIGVAALTSETLIRSIVGLGNAFNLRIVAEGVEDAETLERLAAFGCHVAQGFHLGRPQTSLDFLERAARFDHPTLLGRLSA